jgi:tetratricopeptide (TPR) repeat protein
VEADPNSAQGHSLLGQALRKLRQTDEAREHLKKAVELGADDYRTWYMLGDTLESLDDHEGAVEAFDKAMAAFPGLTADPAGESVYRRLARLHRRAEAPEMEMRVLAAAAALDPADVKNRWKLARHYEKEPATAIAFLREIAWVQPEDKALYDALAKALAARKEYAAAVERRMIVVALIEAGQTSDEEKDKGEEYREIAALYLAQGLNEKARDFAKEALKLLPGDERARKLYDDAGR